MPTINPTTEEVLEDLDFSCECFQAARAIGRHGKRDRYVRAAEVDAKLVARGLHREHHGDCEFTAFFRVVDAHGEVFFKGTIEQIGVWVDSRPSAGRLVRVAA